MKNIIKSHSPSLRISCIVNPQAANKKWQRRQHIKSYLQQNLDCQIIDFQKSKTHTIQLAKEQSLQSEVIVAVGGDGTVADVIQGIIEAQRGKQTILGILPLGSGNAFRKSLGIPKNFKKALNIIKEMKAKEVDLISIEGRTAGFVSIGATAKVTQTKLEHKIHGLWGHLLASKILPVYPRLEAEIELIDGLEDNGQPFLKKLLKLKLFDCVVGKTNFFGYSWKVAPQARIDDGYLDITLFEIPGIKYILAFPFIYFGIFQRRQKHFKAKKLTIRGHSLPIQYNGEWLGERKEIQLEVLPGALKIISG